MVALAATSIVIVIMVIAVLCVKSKSYKYKRKYLCCCVPVGIIELNSVAQNCTNGSTPVLFYFTNAEEVQKTLEESIAMSIDERQELALELYRSRHGVSANGAANGITGVSGTMIHSTLGRRTGTILSRKGGGGGCSSTAAAAAAAASLGKSPPRPSPASVAYHSDEESLKCYDENPDDSSVTEKPSEMSSSDSQVRQNFDAYFYVQRPIWNYSSGVGFAKKNQFLNNSFLLSLRPLGIGK